MKLSEIIKARGRGAPIELWHEIMAVEGRDIARTTISRWIRRCRVEECGDIYWIGNNKFMSNMNLTPEESERCKQFSA